MTEQKQIAFSPPDITQTEIDAVVAALKSGWITTGPQTKELERQLAAFTNSERVACLSSATAALECALRLLGIGPDDEVITSAYTYTASCAVICHLGARPVLCDVASNTYEMDYNKLPSLINEHTRAIIPVDLAGRMVNYDRLFAAIESAQAQFKPMTENQSCIGRVAVVADGAHSLGASYHGRSSGSVADLTAFSFHAVKNLTTAEGGALSWRSNVFNSEELYHELMLMSLHGQTKDALSKERAGSWEYDVMYPGWKCNMTDLQASLGLAQLSRYPELLNRRFQLIARYVKGLSDMNVQMLKHFAGDTAYTLPATRDEAANSLNGFASSGHLMLIRLLEKTSSFRNAFIEELAHRGVSANVHYKPLPLLSAYKKLGFDIADFPAAYAQFENEVTLPLHTLLSLQDVDFVVEQCHSVYKALEAKGLY